MRIDSLGIDAVIDHNRKVCKVCGGKLYILPWSRESMGGMMICVNIRCILKNQPQTFANFEKVRV